MRSAVGGCVSLPTRPSRSPPPNRFGPRLLLLAAATYALGLAVLAVAEGDGSALAMFAGLVAIAALAAAETRA
jgi:hypothetical protein